MNPAAQREAPGVDIVTAADPGWDAARQAWNLALDQRPAAVALPASAEQVAALVEFARENGLRIAAQGTGHGAAALGSLEDTLLVKTERMRAVSIDPAAGTARVGAGVLWAEVTGAAAEHGLAALAGSAPDVGVVGYTLGGGISWLARRHGFASNRVTAVELVTADGRHVQADANQEPDLFWALRGGGGSFGVVTALEFELLRIEQVYAGMLAFPIERAAAVLHAWREWTATVPDEVTSIGRLLRVPPLPDIPEFIRGRQLAVVEATILAGEEAGAALIEPLRALGPDIDTFATVPPVALQHLHMDPPEPVAGITDHMLLAGLPADAVDALVEVAGAGRQVPMVSIEVRHLGGALARAEDGHGAATALDAPFATFAVGMAMTPEMAAAVEAYRPVLRSALEPFDAGGGYLNFRDAPTDPGTLFEAGRYERLGAVKAKHDPGDLFRANHTIPAVG